MSTKAELEQTLADERRVIQDLQDAYGELTSENLALTQERDLLHRQWAEADDALSLVAADRDQLTQERDDLRGALDLKERQLEPLVRRFNNIQHEVTAVGEELGRLQ